MDTLTSSSCDSSLPTSTLAGKAPNERRAKTYLAMDGAHGFPAHSSSDGDQNKTKNATAVILFEDDLRLPDKVTSINSVACCRFGT